MLNFPIPVGKVTYFKGDITKINPEAYGFFKVEVTAPANLNIPILQTKVLTPNGHRTVAPLGTWTDYIYSPEMENAITFGYKFKSWKVTHLRRAISLRIMLLIFIKLKKVILKIIQCI